MALSAPALVGLSTATQADQVILDDLIVDGSICVGQDCVNGESFGFDTLRLKENNLRIKAQDTSTSASFPSNDWQITFNDSSNGGANKFSIDDIDGGRTPFTLEAGAPSHSLYVDDGGRIGLGTSTPVVEVHVVDGDSPTLRLEQDGSSGFTPQTWDVAGNETNFFVRDVTNGSRLPLRIKPSAPSNSIYVDTDGDIGFQTTSPSADVDGEGTSAAAHFYSSDGNGALVLEEANGTTANRSMLILKNNGRPRILLQNTAAGAAGPLWSISGGPTIAFRDRTAGVNVMQIAQTSGDVTISGTLTTGGTTCGTGCDAVFDPDFELLSIQDHAELMYEERYLPNVGPTEENKPFNLTDKVGRMLNELEHAHIYIAQLEKRLSTIEESY